MSVIFIDFLKVLYDITVHYMPSQATIPEYCPLVTGKPCRFCLFGFFNSNKNNTLFIFHKL